MNLPTIYRSANESASRVLSAARRVFSLNFNSVPSTGTWFGIIREAFTGAWQSNVETDPPKTLLAFSAVYACVTLIAGDIGKLRLKLMRDLEDEITKEVTGSPENLSPYLAVLRKPNHFQTRIKFIQMWIMSKLLAGNAYVLKRRDRRGMVRALYVLDPNRVTPLVASDASIWYELRPDNIAAIPPSGEPIRAPASEIIHDPMICLWHPLVGVSPITACAVSATMGNKIQANSTNLYANGGRPSGILTAPGAITDATATRLKTAWETNYSGANVGKLAVLGDGLKYESIAMTSRDAQMIEQLKWAVEDVARAFHMPLYKIGGPTPTYNNIEALAQVYYSDCLQEIIESLEAALDEGLELPSDLEVECDLDGLLRMDSATLYERNNKAIVGGWFAPNEARRTANLPPVKGGELPLMQQQYWPLEQLAERPAPTDSGGGGSPTSTGGGTPPSDGGGDTPADPNTQDDDSEDPVDVAAFTQRFAQRLGGLNA